jgi:hypothetical protein
MKNLLPGLIKFSFRFERYYPQVIKFFLNRKLVEYREKGFIHDHNIEADWKGKHHYSFKIDMFLGEKEVETWLKKRKDT